MDVEELFHRRPWAMWVLCPYTVDDCLHFVKELRAWSCKAWMLGHDLPLSLIFFVGKSNSVVINLERVSKVPPYLQNSVAMNDIELLAGRDGDDLGTIRKRLCGSLTGLLISNPLTVRALR